jgi:hypothetical protein
MTNDIYANDNPWATELPYNSWVNLTYEEALNRGEEEFAKTQPTEKVSIRTFPYWLHESINNCSDEVKPKSITAASAQRITASHGIILIRYRFGTEIDMVKSLRKQVWREPYPDRDIAEHQFLMKTSNQNAGYSLQESVYDIQGKCSLREWTAGAIEQELKKPLGLTESTATLLTLIASVSASTSWVPSGWKNLAIKELRYFETYLKREAGRLKTEVLKNDRGDNKITN